MGSKFLLGAALVALAPAAASAATWDFAADYGNAVFSYGYGQGTTFTAFPNSFAGGCFGVAQLACQTAGSNSSQPIIGAATDGLAFSVQTVDVTANTLLFHPGPDGTNSDAILRFIAPTAGAYRVQGRFLRLDRENGSGNGVVLSAFVNSAASGVVALPNAPQFVSTPVGPAVLNLAAGDIIQLNVGNNGQYFYDSTGLQGSIAMVPEPSTWAVFVLGFGVMGAAMRRRQRTTVRYA